MLSFIQSLEVVVDCGTDEGMELLVLLAEWRKWVGRVEMLRFGELGAEALLPISTTRRVLCQFGFGTATGFAKERKMLLLCTCRQVILAVARMSNDIASCGPWATTLPCSSRNCLQRKIDSPRLCILPLILSIGSIRVTLLIFVNDFAALVV